MTTFRVLIQMAVVCLLPAIAGAQAATPAAATPAAKDPQKPAAPEQTGPTPPSNYAYTLDGRRDPFISLIKTGNTDAPEITALMTRRPAGVAGLMTDELVVRGIVLSQGQWVAMVGSPDGKTHSVRPGDQLMDGEVRAVTPQMLVVMQVVNDPLSSDKRREIRKYLRGAEEGK